MTAAVFNLRGGVKEVDPGTWKPSDKAELKLMVALTYIKLMHGGELVYEIDVTNMVRNIGGVDQLAAQRNALGV